MAMSFARPDPSSPASIADASFSTGRRGFDQNEVRDFLRMVAAELGRLQERERFLERELRAAQTSPDLSSAQLDEATITRLLGEETARVLVAARESAGEIRAKAEQAAAQMLDEASEETARLREEAELDVSRRRADAAADAQAQIEMAKQQGRDMVEEARAYRERVLAELARRRELAREQIEQLIQGRDRLMQTFERARLVAVDVVAELQPLGEPDEYVDLTPTTGPVPVTVAHAGSRALPTAQRSAGDAPSGPDSAVADVEPEPADIEATDIEAPDIEAAVTEAPGTEATDIEASDADASDAEVSDLEATDIEATDIEASDIEASDAEAADTDALETDRPTAPFDRELDDVDEDRRPGDVDDEHGETVADRSDDTGQDDTGHEAGDDTGPDDAGDDAAQGDTVVDLFARIRADVAAEHVPGDVDEATVDLATVSGPGDDEPLIVLGDEPLDVEGTSPEALIDGEADPAASAGAPAEAAEPAAGDGPPGTPFEERDEQLTPLIVAGARKLKRVLADEQNEVLDALRRSEPVDNLDLLLPWTSEHVDRYADAIADDLLLAAHAGAASVTDGTVARLRAKASKEAVAGAGAVLEEYVVVPLRERLDRAVADGAGDNAAITKTVRAIYREWKTRRIDEHLDDVVRTAHGRGVLGGLEPGSPVRWATDPSVPACADCDDNVLGGVIEAGAEFPTGHTFAPAHPGCRCLLQPVGR